MIPATSAASLAAWHPSGAEARGKWRAFRRELIAQYPRMDRVVSNPLLIAAPVGAYLHRSARIGRARALAKVSALVAPARLEAQNARFLTFSYLKARQRVIVDTGAIDDPGLGQDTVCVHYLLLGKLPNRTSDITVADGLWSIEITDHAGRRLLERDPQAVPATVIRAAHRTLLQIDRMALLPYVADHRKCFLLPAGRGWFLCQALYCYDDIARDRPELHIRARSWLHEDMAVDQYQTVPPGEDGEQVGESWLRPVPLRP